MGHRGFCSNSSRLLQVSQNKHHSLCSFIKILFFNLLVSLLPSKLSYNIFFAFYLACFA